MTYLIMTQHSTLTVLANQKQKVNNSASLTRRNVMRFIILDRTDFSDVANETAIS